MKKLLSLVLSLALLITLLPPFSTPHKASAAGTYFLFPNEQYTSGSARITTDQRVTLKGTINNVVGNSISYSVYNVSVSGGKETVVNSIENQTANISLSGNNISVNNVELYPGLNKLTFKGIYGTSTVSESIYIEYRNSPMLYDLTATIRGTSYPILEDQTTVLQSALSDGKTSEDISISGKAPNATKVSVSVNGKSYEYNVSDAGDYKFVASPLNIKAGKNIVTIRVYNNSQVVETTREIAFYNGSSTFYDMSVTDGTTSIDLDKTSDLSVGANKNLTLSGKAIIPVKYANNAYTPNVADFANLASQFQYLPQWVGGQNYQLTATDIIGVSPDKDSITPSTKYITVSFSFAIGDTSSTGFSYETPYRFKMQGYNVVDAQSQQSGTYTLTLHNSTLPYIYDVNYLTGYTAGMKGDLTKLQVLEGTDIENANIYSLPMGVEVLIGNYNSLGTNLDNIVSLVDSAGKDLLPAAGITFSQDTVNQVVYKNVNGVSVPFLRVFMEISKLPTAGTQQLYFKVKNNNSLKGASIKLLYGPFVKYDSLYNGMQINYDTTMKVSDGIQYIFDQLGSFAGQFMNIANEDEIVYAGDSKPQTVFFYINNVEVPLEQNGSTTKTKFKLAVKKDSNGVDTIKATAFGVLNKTGENTFKIVYKTSKNNYENTVKINIVPTNLPSIPAANTDGVYPYSVNLQEPLANDPNFTNVSNIYSTKEARMNVYGTFDFVDLGDDPIEIANKMAELQNPDGNPNTDDSLLKNYILKVSSPNFTKDITWDLTREFTPTSNGKVAGEAINSAAKNGAGPVAGIKVYYDIDKQYFYFIMEDQEIPEDGSAQVFTFTVFNSGEAGPRATYRLEVDPVAIPYTVLAPVTEERNLNSNFVDVIIASPGADSMTINKLAAKKVTYLDYSQDPVTPVPIAAYKVRVTGLKANKETAIPIVITRGKDKITDSLTVNYEPANIPGAQYTETMANSHKVFDGSLALTFPKNTKLVRPSYNSTSNNSSQIYSGNQLLFGIANPTDGVINRYEFRSQPADYWSENAVGSYYLSEFFSDRFIKVSSLFWIDGGLADDDATKAYDPVTSGQDPYPYAMVQGDPTQQFFKRFSSGREVVPSLSGTLTLSYDPNISQGAGTVVTVFRYDPYENVWENMGGTVDEKKHTIKVPFQKFGYYVVGKLTYGFNDINDHSYARNAMEAIFAKGVMNAEDPTGIFGADQYVSRGEFARMIVKALSIPLNYEGPKHFIDVPIDPILNIDALYDYRYIETAARAGIVRGTQPVTFEPDTKLTRQDASVILAKALNLKLETNAAKAKAALDKAFKDSANADYYAVPSILAIQKKGFIQGSMIDPKDKKAGYVFEPRSRLLRSDASILIAKVMASNKTLPAIYAN
ncbi:S-layer homology domain-containing protein [Paenibacillus sp. MMO-58]|uniref:S-layer homology domain-containing protein n=1 Tax=Paenibacillus sp. MMO-58 TaxID=3081290 RepID=UPI0030187B5E